MKEVQHEEDDKKLFNEIAEDYFRKDIYSVSAMARKFQLQSLISMYYKKFNRKNLGNILEIGCGVGASTLYLTGLYDNYIGIDYAENLIKLARDNFANDNNKFVCANIKDIPGICASEEVDFIFGVGALHHVKKIESVLTAIRDIGNENTVFGFIEPQASNPIIQLMRRTRMLIDRSYSSNQVFFKKNDIQEVFKKNGFKIIVIKYQGYFSPPFAQVILKPEFFFKPVVRLSMVVDDIVQNKINNPLSWNIIWLAQKT
jgi:cyclopropane fatty-acyl-phospholipid synthase-like methyltransferase